MKWGNYYEAETHDQLLFLVLQCVLRPYNFPLDRWLKEILEEASGIGGDPGWSMEYLSSNTEVGAYQIWVDPDISEINQAEAIYSADVVRHALKESLLAFGDAYPERLIETQQVLRRYNL
jgi:hypothetical protein